MSTISVQASRWLAAISCENDDYVIVEACFADTADSLIAAIYEVYHTHYGDDEIWSISVTPCLDAEQFHTEIIPFDRENEAWAKMIADSFDTPQESQKQRVYDLFLQKLEAKYPGHPWTRKG